MKKTQVVAAVALLLCISACKKAIYQITPANYEQGIVVNHSESYIPTP